MSIIVMLIPILFFVVITMGIGTYMVRSNNKRSGGLRKIKWLLGGYTLVLLLATAFSVTLLPEHVTEGKMVTRSEMDKVQAAQSKIIDRAFAGKLENVKGAFLEKENWSFPFKGSTLDINMIDKEMYGIMVFVEKKKINGVVEATHYYGKSYIDGMDFTDKIESPSLAVDGKTLSIKAPKMLEVSFTKFSEGFAFSQFSGTRNAFEDHHTSVMGNDFILLSVPSDLNITGDVNFVNE
ncbi:hypothetical protein AWM68_09155 [Fictibacillus phosphorivorans]|uniref:Uncharacterized protein n=1 Tax=Fictibacillus phosphorivorans TaxID=1221500 RepID=A0A161RTJ8_9BACL|nr:hypothetical protein [Fictibacillus phosphorivorans]KZE64816.1 hypothetical protein AWM68_09155 [Fictibacillus phosphorivorans]